MLRTLTAVLFLLLLPLHSSSAASLVTDANGILTGARDILVGVNKYDVVIGNGTCAGLFSGCDEQSDFPFIAADVYGASDALLALLQYDTRFVQAPTRISGCEASGFGNCILLTPYRLSTTYPDYVDIIGSLLPTSGQPYSVETMSTINHYNAGSSGRTYAVWTKSQPATVPEPSTLMLLGIGLLSQRWLRTRGKRVPV
ncbi:PEP-CTERM sorting domain-containing protein [Methylomonas sp. HW2-6]|uniref:PEP-CTERM sorting domain-containing protein n=1 Tax=Methylomonas sp. HW2-6 TaxID=3376687 RepID=UPI004042318B